MVLSGRQIEILEAATKLIGEKGIQNFTTKNLAKEMKFSEPAIYRHFAGKSEILQSVLIYYKNKAKDDLQTVLDSESSALMKIKEMMQIQFTTFSNNPAIIMIIFAETSFQYEKVLSTLVMEILEQKQHVVSQIIRRGQMEGSIRNDIDTKQLNTMILGSMRLTVLRWRLSDFDFDLIQEGNTLWKSFKTLLKTK